MSRIINRLTPFIFLGIALAVFAVGLILFAYLFIIGLMIGIVIYLIAMIKHKFFAKKIRPSKQPSRRVIDSDDWKVM